MTTSQPQDFEHKVQGLTGQSFPVRVPPIRCDTVVVEPEGKAIHLISLPWEQNQEEFIKKIQEAIPIETWNNYELKGIFTSIGINPAQFSLASLPWETYAYMGYPEPNRSCSMTYSPISDEKTLELYFNCITKKEKD